MADITEVGLTVPIPYGNVPVCEIVLIGPEGNKDNYRVTIRHEPRVKPAETMDDIAKRVRQMRRKCRHEAEQRGQSRDSFFEGEMRGYWNVLSLISSDPNIE